QRLRGLIRPDPAVCATAGAACGRKSLSSARIQAIFTSNDTPLGECRIRVPVHILERISRFRRTRHALGLDSDTSGTAIRKIAESLGWTDAFTARIAQIAEMRTVSLDATVGPDQETTLAELVADSKPGPEDIAISNDTAERVRAIIEELNDDRLKDIVMRRFGLEGVEETLQSIGDSYGITRERIRQLEEKAMKSLKRYAIKKKLGTSRGMSR
ncbi:MAG: sigma factor-like helix-turn-helix DNA-binding protein, partial [Pyrinomonadaceae bacterium]